MLRSLLFLVLVLAAPKLSVTGTRRAISPDSLRLTTHAWARNLGPADTIRYDYLRNDSLQMRHRSPTLFDSADVGKPKAGTSAVYLSCAQIERGGRTSGQVFPATGPKCWSTTFARPLDPVLDSVTALHSLWFGPAVTYPAPTSNASYQAPAGASCSATLMRMVDSLTGIMDTGCRTGAGGVLTVTNCATFTMRDGTVRWLWQSAHEPTCAGAGAVLAQRYGATWHPELPAPSDPHRFVAIIAIENLAGLQQGVLDAAYRLALR